MDELADECVQSVVTSPPYWGLRKYSGSQDLIWGDNHCGHEWGEDIKKMVNPQQDNSGGMANPIGRGSQSFTQGTAGELKLGNFCSLCGAWKGAYGLEPTPEMYIQHTIEILREIRRVLRKDGVVFWNIGDSYAGGHVSYSNKRWQHGAGPNNEQHRWLGQGDPDLKPKDLCLIPFRVAIAAQEDGWWVRSIIIWSKPNPMPESVTDRPTESHEYILMLTKSAKYYWEADAVREPNDNTGIWGDQLKHKFNDDRGQGKHGATSMYANQTYEQRQKYLTSGRNLRSVWTFPTQPYPEAHFAVFPEKLPETCIKAATPEVGCCSKCGAPWERILDKKSSAFNIRVRDAKAGRATPEEGHKATQEEIDGYPGNHPDPGYRQTTGWQVTCKCNADKVPSTVLDPFMGSGTTLWVAKVLNRRAVGYETSEEYCQLALERNRQTVMEMQA